MESLKKKKKLNSEKQTTNLVAARGGEWGSEGVSEGGEKVQTSSCKVNQSRGCNGQHGDRS